MNARPLRRNIRFRRLCDHLHALGPRPTGEILIELVEAHDIEADVLRRLENYALLEPTTVASLGARHWPAPPLRVA